MTDKINILIIEHHLPTIEGYIQWTQSEEDMHVLGHADHPQKAIQQFGIKANEVNVILSDHSFPDGTEIPTSIPSLTTTFSRAAIVVVTGYRMPSIFRALQAAKVDGILTKDDDRKCLLQAIRSVHQGATFQSRMVRDALDCSDPAHQAYNALTNAQQKAVELLATGAPDKQILDELCIARSTLDGHRTAIYETLRNHGFEVFSKSELVNWHREHRGTRS